MAETTQKKGLAAEGGSSAPRSVREHGWALYAQRNDPNAPCVFCGEVNDPKRYRGGRRGSHPRQRTVEHLAGQGATKGCFVNPHLYTVPVHYDCNMRRAADTTERLSRLYAWYGLSLHPAVRKRLPKGRNGDRHGVVGPRMKRGQGAWQ
jgi:hypothetical protein